MCNIITVKPPLTATSLQWPVLSALNSELSFIVLEPVNNPTDYEHPQSYNMSADCKSTVQKHISHEVAGTLAYYVILLTS